MFQINYNDQIQQVDSFILLTMKSQINKDSLLKQWIKTEMDYFVSTGQLTNGCFMDETQIQWDSLISNGFVLKLFQSIDSSGFTDLVSFEALNHHQLSTQQVVGNYWNSLNNYLEQKYNKKINENYLCYITTFRESSDYTDWGELDNCVISLVKLLFYLLVQKQNKSSNQFQSQNGDMSNQISLGQLQGKSMVSEISSICGENQLLDVSQIEMSQQNYSQSGMKSEFLQRICQLPQEVQEYLVTVIEEVEQSQILQSLKESIYNQDQQQDIFKLEQTQGEGFRRIMYRQIERLSEQNEQLKQKIQQIIDQNENLQKQIEYNVQQQNRLLNKINKYNEEKQDLFVFLKMQNGISISSLEEFIQVVKHIEQENQLLENTIAEIQEKNYQLETNNAMKVHSINKSALEITKVNDEIGNFKTKIKGLKQDIQYLDEIVNSNQYPLQFSPQRLNVEFSAQMVHSINVQDENQILFKKSINNNVCQSFDNVLRQNRDIYNQKMLNQTNRNFTQKRNHSAYKSQRLSLQTYQKSLKHNKSRLSRSPIYDQENIQPFTCGEQEQSQNSVQNHSSNSYSKVEVSQQQIEQQQIETQKQKYRQQLVNNLDQLYKQIADLTGEIAQIKESNKYYQNKNKYNDHKIAQLKSLHQAFLKEIYNE